MLRYRHSVKDLRILKVLSRISQSPAVSVRGLAQLVNLSSSRLGHLFKREMGVELRHFLLEARLEKAAELLQTTDMQIKEISHIIGYHHVPSFDRIFRKKYKVSPMDYRRDQPATSNAGAFEVIPADQVVNGNSGNG